MSEQPHKRVVAEGSVQTDSSRKRQSPLSVDSATKRSATTPPTDVSHGAAQVNPESTTNESASTEPTITIGEHDPNVRFPEDISPATAPAGKIPEERKGHVDQREKEKHPRDRTSSGGLPSAKSSTTDTPPTAADEKSHPRRRKSDYEIIGNQRSIVPEEFERKIVFHFSRAAECRDPDTGGHIMRIAHFSRHIGRHMGLSESKIKRLFNSSPMHDAGKVGIPDNVLLKPGLLSEEEFEIMKVHTLLGYEILHNPESKLLRIAAEIALTHHERWDGSGYPRGLKGEMIPLFGRIVAVADVFDALRSRRPYKDAWSMEQACNYLREHSGSHFDPACVQAFFQSWDDMLLIEERLRDRPHTETRLKKIISNIRAGNLDAIKIKID